MKNSEIEMICIEDLTDLKLLRTHCIYADEFENLPKERQTEIYEYCQIYANVDYCRENLKQIRYAATKLYFGIGF